VLGDFDKLARGVPEWSSGYVPTVLLVRGGSVIEKFAGNDYDKINAFIG